MARGLAGAIIFTTGVAAIAWVLLVAFSDDPALEAVGFKLGLACNTLISALGQATALIGFWVLWSVARPTTGAHGSEPRRRRHRTF